VALMRVRTQLGSVAQGLCKELGLAIPKHTSANLAERLRGVVPPAMREIFRPLLGAMADVQKRLAAADTALARRAPRDTPQAARFAQQVPSVGILTAAAFVVAVHDPRRFDRARDAGAYFGLEPKERASGAHDPRLGITKAGNKTVRWLLVQAAHGLLKTNGTDCALRDAGLRLLRREGPGARQRAAVAVARKLAVLLVALWKSGEDFRPHPAADTPPAPAA
jgi:transposase